MNRKNRGRKGATIAELLVVLAVLVIASTMVVSFSSMMHGAQGVSNARLEALQDVHLAESLIEGFIESNASPGSFATITKNDGNVEQLKFGEKFTFFSNGFLVVHNGEENTNTLELESITSITFDTARYGVIDNNLFTSNSQIFIPGKIENADTDAEKNALTPDTLYYCTINYSVSDTDYTYTFCVNPYVGEEVN